MAEDEKMQRAQATFNALCQEFDKKELHYNKDEEELSIECGISGDDIPMEITMKVDADRQIVVLLSHLPFVTPENKRVDLAMAVSAVNNMLVDGCFDFDIRSGHMFFRLTSSFIESEIGGDLFMYMLGCSGATIDEYNDRFLMMTKGMLSLEKFLEFVEKK